MARNKPAAKSAAKSLSALEKRFARFGQAKEVLTSVKSVPTRFIQLDHALRIGGWPTQRSAVFHGPSNEGKTVAFIGLADSFVRAGHLAQLVDAERTTTIDWCEDLMGDLAKSERFFAMRPDSYESCVDEVRAFHREVKAAREAGDLPPETTAITLVDSLRKLVPEDIMKKILKDGASGSNGSVDGMGGRAAQIRAAMNAAWMDELIPLLDECGTSFAAIARESEDPNADVWAKKFGNDYKVGGGKAVIYDAAVVVRVQRASWVTIGDGENKKTIGERHRMTIRKTKVGGKEDRVSIGYFHTSNGVMSPAGFDPSRDLVELGLKLGVLDTSGSWISWKGEKWPSREKMISALREADGERETLEAECRARFAAVEPETAGGDEE